MAVYLTSFAIAICFAAIAEQYEKNGNKTASKAFLSASALVFIVIAGLRSDDVGIDIKAYALPYYTSASLSLGFFEFLAQSKTDFLYAALCFVCARLNSFPLLLACSQALVVIPVYYLAYKMRKNQPVYQVVFIYAFAFFNISLCLMRQFIAGSFLLLASILLLDRKTKNSIVCFAIALLFHKTSIFYVAIALPVMLLWKAESRSQITVINVLFVVLLTVFSSFLLNILMHYFPFLLNATSLKPEHMESQTVGILGTFWKLCLTFLPILAICFSNTATIKKSSSVTNTLNIQAFSALMCLDGFILGFTGYTAAYLSRISYYFIFFWIFSTPLALRIFNDHKGKQALGLTLCVGFVLYWFYVFILMNGWGTVDYVARI